MIKVKEDRANMKTFVSIDDATFRVRKGLRIALLDIGKENSRHVKRLIRKPPKSGRLYKFKGRRHQASASGEAPANRSGRLARSVGYKASGWVRVEFGDRALYGKFLERGTRKMAPRPHLVRTADEKRRDNFNSIVEATGKEIRRK